MVYVKLVLTMIFWGGTFIAGRLVGESISPLIAACGRFVIASFCLLAVLQFGGKGFPQLSVKQWLGMALAGLTGIYSYNLLFFAGLQNVEAGRAAVIIAGNPVVTTLLAILLLGERFGPVKIIGIFLSILGGVTVVSRGEFGQLLQGDVGIGELYLVGCVLSWAAYALIGRKLLARISPLVAVTYSCILGTVLLVITAAFRQEPVGELWQPATLFNLAYLAVFGTVIGFTWFYSGVQKLGAGRASLFVNLVPVSGVSLGILLLGERPDNSLFMGGILVLAGLLLINLNSNRLKARQDRSLAENK